MNEFLKTNTAAAFTPAPASRMAKSSVKMSFEGELGVLPPVGYFDPLGYQIHDHHFILSVNKSICSGLSKGIDAERFLRYRAVEIKHGRVAMLAVTGSVIERKHYN